MNCRKDQIIKVFVSVLFVVAAILILAPASWAATDVYVTDIYTPTSLVALQDTTVTAELTNYGDAVERSVKKIFYCHSELVSESELDSGMNLE